MAVQHPKRSIAQRAVEKVAYLWQNLTFRPYQIDAPIHGEVFRFEIADLVGKSWYDRVSDWPELCWVSTHLIAPGDCIIDCGTHHALSTLLFARRTGPAGYVIGVEAHPRNAEVARRNAALNRFANIEILNAAITERSGTTWITSYSNAAIAIGNQRREIKVQAVTIDELSCPRPPDFIKIDVEGMELQALQGARRTLETTPNIDLELHCCYYDTPVQTLTAIHELLAPTASRYKWYVQRVVESPLIVPFDFTLETMLEFVGTNVIHLFGERTTEFIPRRHHEKSSTLI